jgi:biopolymer transport protein ExbD
MPLPPRIAPKTTVQIPMTALIDIVFLLLIFFLLTTNYLTTDSLPVNLPHADTAAARHENFLTIGIDAHGAVYLDGDRLSDKQLRRRLKAILKNRPARPPVAIRSDRTVSLERVVTVLDIARSCGARQLSLVAEKRGTEP